MGSLNFPTLDSLIAQMEGFGKPGVPATVNNNPGNLIPGTFSTAQGATGSNAGFAVFPDPATGIAAQDALVSHYANQNLSIADLINKWSPPNAPGNTPTATQNYIDFVSNQMGVDPSTPISQAEQAAQKKTPDISTSGNMPQSGSSTNPQPASTPTFFNPFSSQTWSSIMPGGANSGTPSGALSFGRIGAFVLGFVLIAGGIYLFKGPEIVSTLGKATA